ncbi:MAG: type I glutamate--ammonia ligase [Legionellaceae bacterium]|nr:type I glutamate--ammonia ligase [Legionellaceae bacterium]
MSTAAVYEFIKTNEVKFVDLRFTDLLGKEHHITLPVSAINDDFLKYGKNIDGSSFKGWQRIHQSDLALVPDLSSAVLDPFYQETTLVLRCDVYEPSGFTPYVRCPRALARRAEEYLRASGVADTCYFGPEPEFFIFDHVRWDSRSMHKTFYEVDSEEANWNSDKVIEGGNTGHRPSVKGGYFPVPPVDSSQDIRSAICTTLEAMGLVVEAHHHEVATANQCEVATRFNSLTRKADEIQILKYVIHNIAHVHGKSATFMPKPLYGDNGSGMHCHQSLEKDGQNLFAGAGYEGLSETAMFYIGGIIRHARALNAFTNPSINSYKRLVPGFEAPVLLAYSGRNRSASIRIPVERSSRGKRIEVRFPDGTANPYLAFAAMMMAGLDGIQQQIHPGDAVDEDLYELPPERLQDIPTVSSSLDMSLQALRDDNAFLTAGGVFTADFIEHYIALKEAEVDYLRGLIHPAEFELYYSL